MAYNYEYPYVDPNRYNSDWALHTIKDISNRLEEIEEKVKLEITMDDLLAAIEEAKEYTDNALTIYTSDILEPTINTKISAYNVNIRAYIKAQDEATLQLANEHSDKNDEATRNYIDSLIIEAYYMEDPITGEIDTIPNVINNIVSTFHRQDALTAYEYDTLELTAEAYDLKLISAYDYDFRGKTILIP